MKKIKEVCRLVILDDLVGNGGYFKVDALFYRKPMKFNKSRSDVIRAFKREKDSTSKGILDML